MRIINVSRIFLVFLFCFIAFEIVDVGVCSASELQKNVQKSNSAATILQDIPLLSIAPVRQTSSTSSSLVTSGLPCWKTDDFKNRCQRLFNTYSSLIIFFEILGHRMENKELRWACMFILAYREQKDSEAQIELFRFNSQVDFDTCFDAYQRRKEELESPMFRGEKSEDETTNVAEDRANWMNGWLKYKH